MLESGHILRNLIVGGESGGSTSRQGGRRLRAGQAGISSGQDITTGGGIGHNWRWYRGTGNGDGVCSGAGAGLLVQTVCDIMMLLVLMMGWRE